MATDVTSLGNARQIDTARGPQAVRYRSGTGVPVVLIHGWPECSLSWAATVDHLPDCPVLAPDLRGMGDAPRTPELAAYTKDALAADVLACMDALEIDCAVVLGHDWGGIVAQEIALAAPQRVLGLGIANIAVINNLATNRAIARQSTNRFMWYQHFFNTPLPEAMIRGAEAEWVQYFLRAWRPEGFPQHVLDAVIDYHRIPGTAAATANYYRCYGQDVKRWAALGGHRFAMPATYIHGVHDVVITPEYLEGIEQCFDDLERVHVEAGHFVQDEQPAAVADAIKALMARAAEA